MKNATNITRTELETMVEAGKLRELHTSWTRGYVSRKSDGKVFEYKGRFGEGYALLTPSWESTSYCHITYFVK